MRKLKNSRQFRAEEKDSPNEAGGVSMAELGQHRYASKLQMSAYVFLLKRD